LSKNGLSINDDYPTPSEWCSSIFSVSNWVCLELSVGAN